MDYYLTTCCEEKKQDEPLLPARERYISPRVQEVVARSDRDKMPLMFFSGLYGILGADDLIPDYAKLLKAEDVTGMIQLVVEQLRERNVRSIRFFGRPREREFWGPYHDVIYGACEVLGVEVVLEVIDYE